MLRTGFLAGLLRNATIATSVVFALSGFAFAAANVLLARYLPTELFGRFALAIAIYNVTSLVAPLGTDQMVVRRTLRLTNRLFAFQLVASWMMGALSGLAAASVADFTTLAAVLLGSSIAGGGVLVSATAELRRQGRYGLAIFLFVSPNFLLVPIAALPGLMGMTSIDTILMLYAGGVWLPALCSLILAMGRSEDAPVRQTVAFSEAFALLGLTALATLSLQLERLLLPNLLDFASLATFSLLSSLAVFPFRLINSGMTFALTPQLSAEDDRGALHRKLLAEIALFSAFLAIATILIEAFVPPLAAMLTDGRYQFDRWLVMAACFAGSVMVVQSLTRSIATAVAGVGSLNFLHMLGWIELGFAAAGVIAGARWGLSGVIFGGALGHSLIVLPTFCWVWTKFVQRERARV